MFNPIDGKLLRMVEPYWLFFIIILCQNDGKNTLYHEFAMILTGIFLFYLFWRLLYPFLSTSAAAFRLCSASDSRSHLRGAKSPWILEDLGFNQRIGSREKLENHGKPESFGGNQFSWIISLESAHWFNSQVEKIWRVKGCDTENNPPKKKRRRSRLL